MIAKLSKEVTDRMRAAMFLLEAFAEQGPKVAAALRDLGPDTLAEGGGEQGVLDTLAGFARKIQASMDLVVKLDLALHDLNAEEGALRRRRDELVGWLGQRITGLRRLVLGQFVNPDLDALGLQVPTPREPLPVLRQSDLVTRKFEREDLAEMQGEALFEGGANFAEQASQLRGPTGELRGVLQQITKLRRRNGELVVEKGQETKKHDVDFLRGARIFEDLARYAGFDELADRIRPSTSRPGRTEQDTGVTDEQIDDAVSGLQQAATDAAATAPEPETPASQEA